ncbi:MAG: S41 family peptidase [Planctomycetia bacterium]|nr:S41 family peptidase [Planctomycetia bacterium]
MTPRNLFALFLVCGASLICFNEARLQGGRYAKMFGTYAEVMDQIDRKYLEPTDDRRMFEAALNGIVGSLGDEYSAYIPPREADALRSELEQKFGGVGVSVLKDEQTGRLTITSPLYNTPAYNAGIMPGDVILEINGEDTAQLSMEDATDRMRGPIGEMVRLKIERAGEPSPLEMTLVRAEIAVESVVGDGHEADDQWSFFLEREDRIGYVRIRSFGEKTIDELQTALEWLNEHNARAVILDLRDNAGGLLHSATETCDMFLDSGVIVSTRGRGGVEVERFTATSGTLWDAKRPVVILINEYSASAAEIFAACLQDHGAAIVVGEQSWGKGSVQEVLPLEGGRSVLKLTTASFWRPSGKNIHRRGPRDQNTGDWGVRPDEGNEVKLTEDEFKEMVRRRRERDVIRRSSPMAPPPAQDSDPQLRKALEVALSKLTAA